jgi:hypothetical protein
MKNTHIKAGQEVPIELRKEIYREAFEIVKNWKDDVKYGWHTPYLCWLLPSLLWGKDCWREFEYYGCDSKYHYYNYRLMFPELRRCTLEVISFSDEQRINFLKSVI